MLTTNKDILSKIPDSKSVRVFLPMKDNHERHSVHGVFHTSTPPDFDIHFSPGVLPVNSINYKGICILIISIDGPTTFFEAKISKIKNFQHLVMTALRQISPEQMREFFRVQIDTSVVVNPLQPVIIGDDDTHFPLSGVTVDISASGILASFPKQLPDERQIQLKITLPTQRHEIIIVVAHPVRTAKISNNQFDIAFHFDDITGVDRDKIIECCLIIQRRLLRSKIRVKDL